MSVHWRGGRNIEISDARIPGFWAVSSLATEHSSSSSSSRQGALMDSINDVVRMILRLWCGEACGSVWE